ncbi:MAG: TetR/AcrR family transcriptional regulator [Deltaproteobacteria bacterium]|nr:TetR/AcrR family transcriptional regulator [Deltaproteobacteria bacterium]
MTASISFVIDQSLYLRYPEETALGKKIVSESILMMDEEGYDAFTFKKLAARISSTEASVYRYFRNKHQLLCYLVSWYWTWLEYFIQFRTNNITDSRRKLEMAIAALLESDIDDPNIKHINEGILHRVVVAESARVYMPRPAEISDYHGILRGYNLMCARLMEFIKGIDPKYKYTRELVDTLLSISHNRLFTMYQSNDRKAKRRDARSLEVFLNHLVFTSLNR